MESKEQSAASKQPWPRGPGGEGRALCLHTPHLVLSLLQHEEAPAPRAPGGSLTISPLQLGSGDLQTSNLHLNANAAMDPNSTEQHSRLRGPTAPAQLAISGPPFKPWGAAGTRWSQAWGGQGTGSQVMDCESLPCLPSSTVAPRDLGW